MRRCTVAVLVLLTLASAIEPFNDLLRSYSVAFAAYNARISAIADSIRARYPRTFYRTEPQEGIPVAVEVLGEADVLDSIVDGRHVWVRAGGTGSAARFKEFDYAGLDAAMIRAGRYSGRDALLADEMLKTAAARPEPIGTDASERSIGDFDYRARRLLEMASAIWNRDRGFFESLPFAEDLPELAEWNRAKLDRKDAELNRSLGRFDTRYGPGSDKLNLLELLLVWQVPPFKGGVDGPSRWEPILRLTSIALNASDERVNRAAQVGLNCYFFEDAPGLFRKLNHIGLAAAAVDTSGALVGCRVRSGDWAPGLFVHFGKYQAGVIPTSGWRGAKLIATFDFQLLPTLF